MIYLKDILLTCAALFLLNAALGAKSRITQASAQLEADFSGEPRKLERVLPEHQINSLMSKVRHLQHDKSRNASSAANVIRKSFDLEAPDDEHRENNSYRYYANKTSQIEQQLGAGSRRPSASKPVEVGFLRTSLANGNELAGNRNSNTTLVYMLSSLQDSAEVNEIDTGEQQQPPPFTMMPPYNQQQQQLLLQQQQQKLNGPQNNIRQILSNYQRLAAAGAGPQSPYLAPNAGQQLAPVANQGPANNNNIIGEQPMLRPPSSYPAHNVPNQQQPFSPLQLITGPLQAFQNALNPQNLNSNNNQPHNVPQAGPTPAPVLTPAVDPQQKPPVTNSPAQQQQPPPQLPSFLQQLNPFGPQLNQQQQQQQSQLPNLQALYQQLPLYQALLAARQRQEALQAAHRARHQQPPPSGGLINAGQPPQTQTQPPGFSQPAYGQAIQPVNLPHNQNQPQSGQPQQPPVQFDDDDNNHSNNANVNNNNGQQDNNDNNSNNNNSNDNSNNQQEQANQNEQPEGGNNGPEQADQNNSNHEQGGGGGDAPQEEDPDLKQFQNLANGGDSFTDLFPPGILSNNDITDIKTQQAEQAKKQEEEERQRQLRNQQAQTQSQQQQQQQQPQQHFHQQQNQPQQQQPINQFANNQQQSGNNNQQPASEQDDTDANDNSNNDEPQNETGPNEGEGAGENEGNNETGPGDGNGEDEQEGGEPEAAALTSKSSSALDDGAAKPRLTSSPGVVYSREAGAR